MPAEPSLERLQRWLQAVVVHPGALDEALESPEASAQIPRERLEDVVLPSRRLEPAERVGIYHGMYLLRMQEALESDYPALGHFLGPRGFRQFVGDYVRAHPSRSYTLNRLGDHVPEFVRGAPGLPRPEFCRDLARLERAVSEVFDAAETPALDEAEIAAVPPEAWETARLRPIAAFRLLALGYPVNDYLQSVKDDVHDHPKPRRKASYVAVYRRQYSVYRLDLERAAHDLLADLAAGVPVGEAIAAGLRRGGRRAAKEEALFRWFRQWAAAGIFQAVETRATPHPGPLPKGERA